MIEFLADKNNTEDLRIFAEVLTILVSFLGAAIATAHADFFNKGKSELGKRMQHVFLTDAGIYIITLVMGIALFCNLPLLAHYDIILRPFALILNVYASIRLYSHYRKAK